MSSGTSSRYESSGVDASPLGAPLEFPVSKRSAINRFLNAAMSEKLATYDETDTSARGIPGKALENLYRKWGEGQWGQILTGNIQVDPAHLEGTGNTVIPVDAPFEGERFEGFKAMATAGKAHGSLMVGQVSHPGRQVPESIQKYPISASDVQLVTDKMGGSSYGKPRAATKEDIEGVIKAFTHAAVYMEKAGFDGIQLHGAHGYLLAQFLSPSTNQRTDSYGGSLENRMRIVLEIAASIRASVSERFILGIKINSVEFQEKGFSPDEAVLLCQALEKAGFDYAETSGGTYESMSFTHRKESTRKREAYFIEFADTIHKAVKTLKIYTTGGFKTVEGMVTALQSVDGVGIGRSAAQDADLPVQILTGKATGVAKFGIDEDNMFIRLLGASRQIKQLSENEKPEDLNDPEVVKKILASLGMP
ncbi:putative NADH:flavin oxidoreductase/NADH oxidase N-terminal domain-containing protein [Seiridium unicorne]|uniref:NADH:flavin oxidoreductase/NADH oxidase N-terminal domain-containing protein n=1 Tax=Seiridium unicorne TaxID=138068 RepID=A0ABR2UIM6_9PEZI